MADANRSEAVATVSIDQVMSSVPPQIGHGSHPRYSQHMERERPGGPAMGYGGPPPPPGSYGSSYSSYPPPPPPPYGSSMHGTYGSGSIPGPPPPGYPRAGYSVPPHSSAYNTGYGPGPGTGGYPQSVHHPSYYGAGYENPYGGQPPPGHPSHSQGPQSSYRGPSPIPPSSSSGPGSGLLRGPAAQSSSDQHSLVPAGSALHPKKARSPPGGAKTAHGAETDGVGKSGNPRQSPVTAQQHDHGEVERLRAAAATEITTEEVKPIQTDFHFFVKENIDKYRKLAEEEVRSSMEEKSEKLDPLLVNSNLNTRLMKAWEGLPKESRNAFMLQEEADRRRFMEEDEIASRHCATLTARGKSPRVVATDSNKDLAQQHKQKSKKESQEQEDSIEPKKVVDNEGRDHEEKKMEGQVEGEEKRSTPESGDEPVDTSETQESPSKKTKIDQ